ncbi:MAG: hypothetical protein RIB59_09215 [Rhodospirillales bacterium]
MRYETRYEASEKDVVLDPREVYRSVCTGALKTGALTERLFWRREFLAEIDRTLYMLGTAHLPFSFYSIRIVGLPSARAHRIVFDALDDIGFVGPIPGGAVGFFYIGPHASGKAAQRKLTRRIVREVCRRVAAERAAPRLSLVVKPVHSRTDRIYRVSDLLNNVFRLPARAVSLPPHPNSPPSRCGVGSRSQLLNPEQAARLAVA